MLTDHATLERFKGFQTPITVHWLNDAGLHVDREKATMARLTRSAGATSISIRIDAGDVPAFIAEFV